MNICKEITILFFLGISTVRFQAQEVVATSGGEAQGGGGTSAFSVGQVVYTTLNSSIGSVAQGVQQPYEISVVIGIESEHTNLNLLAYPNPTGEYLNLSIGNSEPANFKFKLCDVNGKLIESKEITDVNTILSLRNLQNGIYFLTVKKSNEEIKTFKVIKN